MLPNITITAHILVSQLSNTNKYLQPCATMYSLKQPNEPSLSFVYYCYYTHTHFSFVTTIFSVASKNILKTNIFKYFIGF